MQSFIFDRYQTRSSLIHSLDPRVKILITVSLILGTVVLPDGAWLGFALTWLLILLCTRLAALELRFVLTRSLLFIPFVLAAATVIFTIPGETIYAFEIFGSSLQITEPGVVRFVSILLRSWISLQAAILLIATTDFPDLIHALSHLKIPKILIAIISFMYRYLFVLFDEVQRLLRARQSRSARISGYKAGGTLGWRARTAGNMAGQLFIRSYERADRVYNAMLARGYQGELMTVNPHRMVDRDWNFLLLGLLCILVIQLLARTIYP